MLLEIIVSNSDTLKEMVSELFAVMSKCKLRAIYGYINLSIASGKAVFAAVRN